MSINFNVVNAILTHGHDEKFSFEVLDWRIDKITDTTSTNHTTQTYRLIIRYQSPEEDSTPKEKICFVKEPISGPLYEILESMNCYNKETLMYTEVLPQMYTIEKESFTPRLYYFDDNMTLVLKDLSKSGYKCADRVQKLDIEHCIYALRCMAKFHALSVKLEKTAGLPEQVKCNPYCNSQAAKNADVLFNLQIPEFIDCVPENLRGKYPNLITYLKNMTIDNVINALNDSSASELNVLNHGDFSINNIMFKYDKYGIVRKVKLIDLQLTSWGSPAQDLIFFFITSMSYEVYRGNFSLLMNIYLNTLNKVLDRLECPTFNMQNTKDMTYTYGKFETGNPYKQRPYREIAVKWLEHLAEKGTLRIDEEHHSD